MIFAIKPGKIFAMVVMTAIQLIAQNNLNEQYNYAKKLFSEENYFDAVTEFKRLLFFDETEMYSYEANNLIGLSYKQGAKFSDAIRHFSLAELNTNKAENIFKTRIEIVKVNILRRTTERALALLNELKIDSRFNDKSDEIKYWTGWAYLFADDWENASLSFASINPEHELKAFCDSVDNDFYHVTLAKTLSIIPGAGQFYTGEYISGLISIGWNVLWGYLTITAFNEDRIFDGVMIGTLLWWRFYSGNLQNAEKFAVQKNLKKTNEALNYLQNSYSGSKP